METVLGLGPKTVLSLNVNSCQIEFSIKYDNEIVMFCLAQCYSHQNASLFSKSLRVTLN